MKPYGVEIRTINGKQYAIWRNRLQNEMCAETNPILWFAKSLEDHDMLICGVKTKREALDYLARDDVYCECDNPVYLHKPAGVWLCDKCNLPIA